jgi:aspartyl/asparaginyl-tRNA synthetase
MLDRWIQNFPKNGARQESFPKIYSTQTHSPIQSGLTLGPFRRMRYEEAIEWLAEKAAEGEKAALNKEGEVHVFGMDIEEAPERYMVDTIGEPIILTHFPRPIKAFYMQPDATDPCVTESCDILIPGVGEIVGASMRYVLSSVIR